MSAPIVLLLAPVHRPWGNRVIREGEALVKRGYDVRAMMNASEAFVHNGIKIIPGPKYTSRSGRFLKIPLVIWRAVKIPADIYHVHNPDMLPVALVLAMAGKKVIYDTHEDFSRRLSTRNWIPKFLRGPLGKIVVALEAYVARKVEFVLVTQPHLVEKYGLRTKLVRNAPKMNESHLKKIIELGASISRPSETQLVYIGSLSARRGIFTMLDALIICNHSRVVRLWLGGQEMDNVLSEAREHPGWRYVDYLGLLPHEMALAYAQRATLGLAVLEDVGDHRDARPTKVFEYMSVGTSFIASDFPKWHEMLKEYDIGTWIKPGDPEVLSEAILNDIINPSSLRKREKAGLRFVSEFNWENESLVLLEVYEVILKAD